MPGYLGLADKCPWAITDMYPVDLQLDLKSIRVAADAAPIWKAAMKDVGEAAASTELAKSIGKGAVISINNLLSFSLGMQLCLYY